MKAGTFRSTVRWTHLGLSAALGTYLYSPWSSNAVFTGSVRWLVFPLLALTGLALWKQAWLLRRFNSDRDARPAAPVGTRA